MQETQVWSFDQEDPLKEGLATHSSILAWRIPMDRVAWQATVHGVAKRWTQLKQLSAHTHMHTESVRQAKTYERLSERTDVITWWIRKWQQSCISRSEIQVNESYDLLWLIFHLIKSCRYSMMFFFISAFPSKIKMVNEYLIRGWVCGWVTVENILRNDLPWGSWKHPSIKSRWLGLTYIHYWYYV